MSDVCNKLIGKFLGFKPRALCWEPMPQHHWCECSGESCNAQDDGPPEECSLYELEDVPDYIGKDADAHKGFEQAFPNGTINRENGRWHITVNTPDGMIVSKWHDTFRKAFKAAMCELHDGKWHLRPEIAQLKPKAT